MQSFVRFIDAFSEKVGNAVSWLTLIMVLVTVYDVLMRYIFKAGSIWIQEAEWHLFAANFMLAGAWTLLHDGHVRVDIFYAKYKPTTRALVDIFGTLLFLLPYSVLVVWASIPFVHDSWAMLEGSSDPGGLPGRYILKTVIPVTFVFVGMQGLSEIIKNIQIIKKGEK
ncbi:TRAP transporter small permease subunit [Dethiosulfatarculus sandiegensis]|uniref:TRAP transporter small permease subunit n=1 Tax=Dethiosulfatarculus sandiegensis TaxID=1429043 RepID=UPI0018D02988|nr:TRAP transporter small permease subunit [Dethiosulfatarculus sandiegensis]